jgi:hypothetical protein
MGTCIYCTTLPAFLSLVSDVSFLFIKTMSVAVIKKAPDLAVFYIFPVPLQREHLPVPLQIGHFSFTINSFHIVK